MARRTRSSHARPRRCPESMDGAILGKVSGTAAAVQLCVGNLTALPSEPASARAASLTATPVVAVACRQTHAAVHVPRLRCDVVATSVGMRAWAMARRVKVRGCTPDATRYGNGHATVQIEKNAPRCVNSGDASRARHCRNANAANVFQGVTAAPSRRYLRSVVRDQRVRARAARRRPACGCAHRGARRWPSGAP